MAAPLKHQVSDDGHLNVSLNGDCLAYTDGMEKRGLYLAAASKNITSITIDCTHLGNWDSSLLSILFKLEKLARKRDVSISYDAAPSGMKRLLELAFSARRKIERKQPLREPFFEQIGARTLEIHQTVRTVLSFVADVFKSFERLLKGQAIVRKEDFLFALEDCSYQSLPIVALISFIFGTILSFVGAMQLKLFGAQIYVASLVMIAMTRLMGALMTGIIMAGRTGASYAATIGTMQVNEETDALRTMGIPVIDFLLLPRMVVLTFVMPLLTVFSDFLGILGGALVGVFVLDLPPSEYFQMSLKALKLSHFFVGLLHGFVFGIVIAFCGCYQGIKCGKDADSVGKATTGAVVSSIVWIVITTSIITITFQLMGI